ncbi:MAG: methanogenesis marker 15 protein [Candidatus Methanospirare jalkutatii]|nr:methanogenesis marker 15 protein [Candidatus Methanospirare jalkutatii]
MRARVAQISCGTEYSGVQPVLNEMAERAGIELVYPEMTVEEVERACEEVGFKVKSPSLNMMIARAVSALKDPTIKGAILLTCFKCSEGTIVKDVVRRFLHERRRDLPVITYSNVEKPKPAEIFARLEALSTIITRKSLLMRERQEGTTLGIDAGSSMTKAVVMRENEIVGAAWLPTTDPVRSADEAAKKALADAGISHEKLDAIGVTGYGRELVADFFHANLNLEEVSVVAKGAAMLAEMHRGEATVIDIGGMSNKLILMRDGIVNTFNLGGICGGSSGRFLEVASHRLDVSIEELGELALRSTQKFELQSYCMVFGIQSLVVALASGIKREDVAAAACRSVAEQVYENQIREMHVSPPIIFVGGVSLVKGVKRAFEELLGYELVVPHHSQFAGAVGIATLASGV